MYSYQIEEASDEKLTLWMANAVRTGSDSLGHTKSQQNEIFAEYYREELIKRGHDIPEIDFDFDFKELDADMDDFRKDMKELKKDLKKIKDDN